jgi:hypothetical protein
MKTDLKEWGNYLEIDPELGVDDNVLLTLESQEKDGKSIMVLVSDSFGMRALDYRAPS